MADPTPKRALKTEGQTPLQKADAKRCSLVEPVMKQSWRIREIFEIEAAVLGYSNEKQNQLLEDYNARVESIVKGVKDNNVNIDREFDLFTFLARTLYFKHNGTYNKDAKIVLAAIPNNEFNCYSSSVLFADVLTRLGKRVNVVLIPQHVFLLGKKYGFETTCAPKESSTCVFYKARLNDKYPSHQVGGLNLLVAISYVWAGHIYHKKTDYNKAIEYYNKAIAIAPKYTIAYRELANAYLGKNDYDNAIKCCRKELELNPDDASTYNMLGVIFKMNGEYDKAIEYCRKALEIGTHHSCVDAFCTLGEVYNIKRDYDNAIHNFNSAISLDPKYAIPYIGAGTSYYCKKDYEKAIKYYKKALNIDPKNAEAYCDLGCVYYDKKDYDKAIEYCRKGLELNPDDAGAYEMLGLAYRALGDKAKAEECFETTRRLRA
jgi:tetratricopeptide (TPR) repeat protein